MPSLTIMSFVPMFNLNDASYIQCDSLTTTYHNECFTNTCTMSYSKWVVLENAWPIKNMKNGTMPCQWTSIGCLNDIKLICLTKNEHYHCTHLGLCGSNLSGSNLFGSSKNSGHLPETYAAPYTQQKQVN